MQTFATGGVCGHLAGQCTTLGGRADCAVATLLAVTGQYSPLCRPLPQGVSVVTWLGSLSGVCAVACTLSEVTVLSVPTVLAFCGFTAWVTRNVVAMALRS